MDLVLLASALLPPLFNDFWLVLRLLLVVVLGSVDNFLSFSGDFYGLRGVCWLDLDGDWFLTRGCYFSGEFLVYDFGGSWLTGALTSLEPSQPIFNL